METSTRAAALLGVGGLVGTLLGATIAPLVNYLTNERQMDVKMVEIGIGILRAPPKEGIAVMREWAVDVIEKSSGRQFSKAQRAVLLNQELLIQWDAAIKWDRPALIRKDIEKLTPSQVDKALRDLEPKK